MAQSFERRRSGRLATHAAFGLLCLLLAIGALRSDLFPGSPVRPATPLEREVLPLALLALIAGVYAALRGEQWPRGRQLGWAIAIGMGLFAAPAVLVHLAEGWVSAFTRVTLFSLTPVFAVVLEPHIDSNAGAPGRGALLGALAAVAGVLCIFPVELPGSVTAAAAVAAVAAAAASIAAANCFGVRVAMEPGVALGPMAAIAGLAGALGLVAANAVAGNGVWKWNVAGGDIAWAASVSLPGLVLLFWLLRRMTAARMTTRFVVAPLMAVLFGIVVDRPAIDFRLCAGLLLIAGGAGWLLYGLAEELEGTSIRE